MLQFDFNTWKEAGNPELLAPGTKLNTAELLFEKIEDDEIIAQIEKLNNTKELNKMSEVVVTPAKPDISYEDFAKLDIRTGTVLAAERVPKTDKLLKLTVDTGIDKRTVVSGIAANYDPEKIIGQKVAILINLQPKMLRGIQSQGMILMAENNKGELCFVQQEKDFENGAVVK
jgi:methionyl-tRNA synthetase